VLLITSEWPMLRAPVPRPASGTVKRQAEALQALGMSVEIFAYRGRNLYNYAAAWTQLRPRLDVKRYDVVHAQDAANTFLVLPKRVPLVVSLTRLDLRPLPQQLAARFLARRADAVVVESEEMRSRVGTRAPVHVIPPGLDEAARTARLVEVYRSVVKATSG
jgi:hypothetical protein